MNPFKRFWRSPPKNEPAYHPVRCEVLCVEDDLDQLEFLSGLIRMQGALVTKASGVAQALEALGGPVQFQLSFVDLRLADGAGSEVVRLIKERRRMTHVVLVSGSPDKIALALEYGYVGVLSKPYSVAAIREIFVKHRLPHSD